jgi:hypothetical protein
MDLVKWIRLHWDRVAAGAEVLGGVIVVLVGWLGVSDQIYPAAQLPYLISGGVFGLLLIGVGATMWLSADLRDEWHRIGNVEDQLAELGQRLEGRP